MIKNIFIDPISFFMLRKKMHIYNYNISFHRSLLSKSVDECDRKNFIKWPYVTFHDFYIRILIILGFKQKRYLRQHIYINGPYVTLYNF